MSIIFLKVAANGSRLAEVAGFSALSNQLATKVKSMQPSSNLQLTRQFWQTAVMPSAFLNSHFLLF
jgi:hypothetical protein